MLTFLKIIYSMSVTKAAYMLHLLKPISAFNHFELI